MENCVIDYNNEINIPQNNKTNFIIKKDQIWNYSITIEFDITQKIDYLNLFFILKSYIHTSLIKAQTLSTVFTDKNNKIFVTQNENILTFRNMSFDYFLEWINYRITNDWKYNKTENFYLIKISFEKTIIKLKNKELNIDILNLIKPIYPWDNKWLNFFSKNIEKLKLLEAKTKALENEIKNLKKKIKSKIPLT
jgi:hypothetical protein